MPTSLSIASCFLILGGISLSACSSSDGFDPKEYDDGSGGSDDGSGGSDDGSGGSDDGSGGSDDGSGGSDDGSGGSDDGSGGSDDGSGGSDDGSGGSDDGSGGSDDGSGGQAAGDMIAPEIVSISPKSGTDGIEEDEVVTITFSEAMDTDSVESALSVSSVNTNLLNLAWNNDKTVVTIIPAAGWDYAEGSPTVKALEYDLLVSKAASDLAGNGLENSAGTDFTTLRRISTSLTPRKETSIYTYGMAVNDATAPADCGASAEKIGHQSGYSNSGYHVIFLDFNFGALGSPASVEEVESAELTARQSNTEGTFYPAGSIIVERRSYGAIDGVDADELSLLSTVGTLATDATTNLSMDISSHLWDLWSKQTSGVAYRIRSDGSASNIYTYLTCGQFDIDVTYLTP